VSAAVIWTTFADEAAAAEAASTLLDERLVACANLVPGLRSIYVWRGERGEARECGALFKTDAGLLELACARLAELHPYGTPAISGWRSDAAAAATLAWLGELSAERNGWA
jgi:periplasmic divalent cation tolerance protein